MPPIHDAVEKGDLPRLERLLSSTVNNINATRRNDGRAPLHIASQKGYLPIVNYLLDKAGADLWVQSQYSRGTALHYACYHGKRNVVEYLIKRHQQQQKQSNATNNNHLFFLIPREKHGRTPLHYACWHGHLEIVQLLVQQYGANIIHLTSTSGKTALDDAWKRNHGSIVDYLLQKGGTMSPPSLPKEQQPTTEQQHQTQIELEQARKELNQMKMQQARQRQQELFDRQQRQQQELLDPQEREQQLHEIIQTVPPKDIFLIHTGAQGQKADLVSTLKYIVEKEHGLTCFLDQDMKVSLDPQQTMEAHLRYCRHTVAIVSKAFLERPAPCAELQYAFDKMKWLRNNRHQNHHGWNSLWVILYDVSVAEYKRAWEATGQKLPAIHQEVQLIHYDQGRREYTRWVDLCQRLVMEINSEDEQQQALEKWQGLCQSMPLEFPLPSKIYRRSRAETGCCPEGYFKDEKS